MQYAQLYCISDLHLGGSASKAVPWVCPAGNPACTVEEADRALQMTSQGRQLGDLLCAFAEDPDRLGMVPQGELCLLLNGDVVDFLAQAPHEHFDPRGAPEKLRSIAASRAFAPFFEGLEVALAGQPRLSVVVNLGNHDIELGLPWVQETFAELVGGADLLRSGRLRFISLGRVHEWRVAGRRLRFAHGNQSDAWNQVEYGQLAELGRSDPRQALPALSICAGTRIVIDVLNELKGGLPFLDIVPLNIGAMMAAVQCLHQEGRLPIGGALQALAARGGLSVWRDGRGVGLLGAGAAVAPAQLSEQDWLEWASAQPLEAPPSEDLLGPSQWWARRQLVRSLEDFVGETSRGDGDDTGILRLLDPGEEPSVLLAGHTHKARCYEHGPHRYLNTGTWADLAPLQVADLTDEGLEALLADWGAACRCRLTPRLRNRATVAVVDEAGGRLREWRGGGLVEHSSSLEDSVGDV
jgi:hypothetical protein